MQSQQLIKDLIQEEFKKIQEELYNEDLLERKMTQGEKAKEKGLKKKMDPHKEEFVKDYMDKGKTREEAEGIYFATIKKRSMKKEEASMAGGNIGMFAGNAFTDERDEENKKKDLQEDDLIEKIMNALISKGNE